MTSVVKTPWGNYKTYGERFFTPTELLLEEKSTFNFSAFYELSNRLNNGILRNITSPVQKFNDKWELNGAKPQSFFVDDLARITSKDIETAKPKFTDKYKFTPIYYGTPGKVVAPEKSVVKKSIFTKIKNWFK